MATARMGDEDDDLAAALKSFDGSGVLKTRRMGYDGKGQRVFRNVASGGFAGTWLAALVRNSTQSYRPMWLVAGCLCALGALLVAAAGRTAPAPPGE